MSEHLQRGATAELDAYLADHQDCDCLEIVSVDMNGMLRGKRIPASEFRMLFSKGLTGPGTTPLMNSLGDACGPIGYGTLDGDPDKSLYAVPGTLAPIPWLPSNTHQVLGSWAELDAAPCSWDPRVVLANALRPLEEMGLQAVIATELEFYLLENTDGPVPEPRLGRIPGTNLVQQGVQYACPEDMWELDGFLDGVRRTCEAQNIPATTAHCEFSPGQFEINLHHVDNAVLACDHAVLLKRLIKGVALQHDLGATFMAKPFVDSAGCGLHVHVSIYDSDGNNLFHDAASADTPPISEQMRHAVGGLAALMGPSQAVFAPNANSYRRLQPGCFAPLSPNWGYNHRNVSLRIPVSDPANLRIEHRVAGADANPYLVTACILAGIHHGLVNRCEPGPAVPEGAFLEDEEITLPTDWPAALRLFEADPVLPAYLGEQYHQIFTAVRRAEYQLHSAVVSNVDYEWYLRSV
jgi:glutamine synthetase